MLSRVLIVCLTTLAVGNVAAASPYATELISSAQGTNAVTGYDNTGSVLGEPSRTTGSGDWAGDVTMFNGPYNTDQIFSIGAGGHVTVKFDHNVVDDPTNPYGFDLLIFGNTFFSDSSWPNGIADADTTETEPGKVAVSQDNVTWYDITGAFGDELFPTQGYTDTSTASGADGSTPSDFTSPVDPTITWDGKTYAQILALYNGSGGGTGVDISGTGLSWIRYVKIYQDATDTWSTEIDGFADVSVPEPTTLLMLSGLVGLYGRSRRRRP